MLAVAGVAGLGSLVTVVGQMDFPVDNDVFVSKVSIIGDRTEVDRFSETEARSYTDGGRKQKREGMGGLR